jgi:hypothetical protein
MEPLSLEGRGVGERVNSRKVTPINCSIHRLILIRRLNMLNRRPRAGGDPVTFRRTPLDSRRRGNDVI